jgi:long-chain acyl-CoA synthetase
MTAEETPSVRNMDHDRIRTLWAIAAYHAGRTPDAVAMDYQGRSTSYAQMAARAEAMDAALRADGALPGERIAYLGKNCDLYFPLLFAASRGGFVLVPLNWRLAPDEWTFILEDAGVKRLIHDDDFAAAAAEQARRIAGLELLRIDDLGTQTATTPEPPRDDPAAVAVQMYTSGTTGRPKGAMLTNWNVIAQRAIGYRQKVDWYNTDQDVTLLLSPVAHIAGTGFGLFGLYPGGRVVIAREFDPAETVRLMNETGVTIALFVPSSLQMLLDYLEASGERINALRLIAYGASPMPEAILARAQAMLPAGFVQMYGMTEAAGVASALAPEFHIGADRPKLRSAGRAWPGGAVGIVNAEGTFLQPGEEGEIAVRSEQVMKGYWKRPEATAEVMMPGGWFRTGDMGRMDEDGFLTVFDRVKDMIITGGENVYPAEVENLLFTHPAIRDAAVIGRPSEKWVEEVAAVVTLQPGATLTLAELREWARGKIAGFKIPRALAIIDELPRNAGGKVLRRELRDAKLAMLD